MAPNFYGPSSWDCPSRTEFCKKLWEENNELNNVLTKLRITYNDFKSLLRQDILALNNYFFIYKYKEYDNDFRNGIKTIKSNILGTLAESFKWNDVDGGNNTLALTENNIKDLLDWLDKFNKPKTYPHFKEIRYYIDNLNDALNKIQEVKRADLNYEFLTSEYDLEDLRDFQIDILVDEVMNGILVKQKAVEACIDSFHILQQAVI